jgi:hypothetical protein
MTDGLHQELEVEPEHSEEARAAYARLKDVMFELNPEGAADF